MILSSGYNNAWRLPYLEAENAAEGWGGGSFVLAEKDNDLLFLLKYIWDSEEDAEEAYGAFETYSNMRFGEKTSGNKWNTNENNSSVYLTKDGVNLIWAIVPNNCPEFFDFLSQQKSSNQEQY